MNRTKNLECVLSEIVYLQKCETYLQEVLGYFGPYDKEINGKDCGNLIRRLHEFLYDFDDNE